MTDDATNTAPENSRKKPARSIGPSARPSEAAVLYGVSLSTIWRWAKERHDFPKPRKLGPRTTVFVTAELVAFRDKQIGGAK